MRSPKCTRHVNQQLHRMAKSRWALSTVVTTLIILVISVLLAGVVTYFAINVTSTRVQEESLALAKQHVWYDSSNQKAQAAIMIINAGGRDIVIDRLTVRGQECAWSKVLFFVTGDSISGDLFYNTTLIDGGSISVGGSSRVFKQATSDLTLQSGKTLIIYMSNPDSISVNDIGLTVSVNIFTSQAMYYKETNVQGTSGTTSTPSGVEASIIQLPFATAYYHDSSSIYCEVAMVLINAGSNVEVVGKTDLIINGHQPTNILNLGYYVANFEATDNLPFLINVGVEVQGKPLNWYEESFTIQPGETAIVYYSLSSTSSSFGSGDVGTNIPVGISLDDGHSVTITVEVLLDETP